MGQAGTYKCNACNNEFQAQEGGGRKFIEYRCIECDTVKKIKSDRAVSEDVYVPPTKEEIGTCEKCGGNLKDDIKPMCLDCKSRDTELSESGMFYD